MKENNYVLTGKELMELYEKHEEEIGFPPQTDVFGSPTKATEVTLQSIYCTLKRIEAILLREY